MAPGGISYSVAFYSFKGGVGRTLALANVAYSLAQRGKRVVLIDLDLEAPGLRQFKEFRLAKSRKGFLDYAARYVETGTCPSVKSFVHRCELSFEGELWLMPSGKRDAGYQDRLSRLEWRCLHPEAGTQPFLEGLEDQLEAYVKPHYVLIDARTGLSDVGGLSTNRMADMVVLVFNLTEGCIEGSAAACRSFLHRDSRPRTVQLLACPVPPSAGGPNDRVERQLKVAHKEMAEALHFGREILCLDYDPAMVLADHLAVTQPERYRAAARLYEDLRKLIQRTNPREVWGILEQAQEAQPSRNLQSSIEHQLREFVTANPDNAEGKIELGTFLLDRGETKEAVQILRESVKVAPRFHTARRRLAEALLADDRPTEALNELDEAERRGDSSRALLRLQSDALARLGQMTRYREVRHLYAEKLFASLAVGESTGELDLESLKRDFVEVLGFRKPHATFDPQRFWLLLMGSLSLPIHEKAQIARQLLKGSLEVKEILELEESFRQERRQSRELLGPDSDEVHKRVAEGLFDLRDVKNALRGDASDVLVLRWAAAEQSDSAKRLELLHEARRLAPEDPRLFSDLLRATTRSADEAWALARDFKSSIEHATDDLSPELLSQIAGGLTQVARLPGQDSSKLSLLRLAESCIAAVTNDRPDSADAWILWGNLLSDLGQLPGTQEDLEEFLIQAIEKYHEAMDLEPDNPLAHYNLGYVTTQLADCRESAENLHYLDQAADYYKKAVEIKPDFVEALENLAGIALRRLRNAENEIHREAHLSTAEDLLSQANEFQSHFADFNLACVKALAGDFVGSSRFLLDYLLSREVDFLEVLGDPDLADLWKALPDLRHAIEKAGETGDLRPLHNWKDRPVTEAS